MQTNGRNSGVAKAANVMLVMGAFLVVACGKDKSAEMEEMARDGTLTSEYCAEMAPENFGDGDIEDFTESTRQYLKCLSLVSKLDRAREKMEEAKKKAEGTT